MTNVAIAPARETKSAVSLETASFAPALPAKTVESKPVTSPEVTARSAYNPEGLFPFDSLLGPSKETINLKVDQDPADITADRIKEGVYSKGLGLLSVAAQAFVEMPALCAFRYGRVVGHDLVKAPEGKMSPEALRECAYMIGASVACGVIATVGFFAAAAPVFGAAAFATKVASHIPSLYFAATTLMGYFRGFELGKSEAKTQG